MKEELRREVREAEAAEEAAVQRLANLLAASPSWRERQERQRLRALRRRRKLRKRKAAAVAARRERAGGGRSSLTGSGFMRPRRIGAGGGGSRVVRQGNCAEADGGARRQRRAGARSVAGDSLPTAGGWMLCRCFAAAGLLCYFAVLRASCSYFQHFY